MIPAINADRLWQSIMDMARIGPTPDGGSCRLALSPEDTQARELLLDWCGLLNLRFEQDAIGNMFLRRNGSDDTASAVAFGSHLDTVPTGGRFDGVFGVLAGLEVIRALDEAGIDTRAPLELVNWTNEEGSRFRPAMMGSRVHAANMVLEEALASTDDNGVSVRDALRDSGQAGALTPSPRGWACWLEAHIEQGPVMESTGAATALPLQRRSFWRWSVSRSPQSRAAAPRPPGSRTTPMLAVTSPTSPGCIATCGTSRPSAPRPWIRSCARRSMPSRHGGGSRSPSTPMPRSVPSLSILRLARCCATERRRVSSPRAT